MLSVMVLVVVLGMVDSGSCCGGDFGGVGDSVYGGGILK